MNEGELSGSGCVYEVEKRKRERARCGRDWWSNLQEMELI